MPVPQPQNPDRPGFTKGKTGNAIVNNGGSIFFAGSLLQNNRIFDSTYGLVPVSYFGIRTGISDCGPKIGSMTGTMKAFANGNFVTMTQGQYILMTFTSQVGGVANTTLRFAASSYRKSQNLATAYTTTRQLVKTGGWYYVNGRPVNATLTRDNISNETSTGTMALPGRITYLSTGKTATTSSYSARTD